MKKNISLGRTFLSILCFIIILFPLSAWGTDIDYTDFSDLSALTLGPRAQQLNPNPDNKLRLISGTWQRGGYAHSSDAINVSAGYSTQFSFQITNLISGGADWIWFVVSRNPLDEIWEDSGWVVIEFDIFNNGARDNYDGNHIGINYDRDWVVVQPVGTSFKNGEVWNVWIDYDGSVMNIYASMDSEKPPSPYISHNVNVSAKIGALQAYVGFYAASGAYGADFDILRWSFTTPFPELSNQPPKGICQDVTVAAGSNCSAGTSIDNGSYDPDGDSITLTQSPPGPYSLGDTPVTLTVTDNKGASIQCGGIVTVIDDTPPGITVASVTPWVLWPPNQKMVDVTVNYNASDNCNRPICQISSVASNEPISRSDVAIVDANHVKLRADRLGSGNGRIYTVALTCKDASGNSAGREMTISVPHDQGRK